MQRFIFIPVLVVLLAAPAASAQDHDGFLAEFLQQFNSDGRKLVALAEAMPTESFDWRPMEGVSSVEEAYMHIARYNYYYPQSSFGVDVPIGVDLETIESVTGKNAVVDQLRQSLEHVRKSVGAMSEEQMDQATTLYGRPATRRAVLLQLITHMNEHLGQQIAYARSNRVVPPWSR
jgi:uncharacterized damage-inducible protein DinB